MMLFLWWRVVRARVSIGVIVTSCLGAGLWFEGFMDLGSAGHAAPVVTAARE
jgi:hypothetical protein